MAEEGFVWLSFAFFAYFVFYTVTTFGLICRSLYETVLTGVERGTLFTPPERQHRPGISLIAPAYNMAPLIAASARALLAADYDPLEVVIVDDGSEDGTTAALDAAFDLVELPVGDRMKIPTRTVLRYYVSRSDPRPRPVRERGGDRAQRGRRPACRPRRHAGKPDRRVSAQLPRRADRLVGDERARDHLRRLRRLPARPGQRRRRAVAADARRGHGAGDAPSPSAAAAAAAHADRPR